ncbi:MAG: hypothetical protein ACRC37_05385 [Lentisphaeria bacterium]
MKNKVKRKNNIGIILTLVSSVIIICVSSCICNYLSDLRKDNEYKSVRLGNELKNLKQRGHNLENEIERYSSWEYIHNFIVQNKLPLKSANTGQVFGMNGEVFELKAATPSKGPVYAYFE